MILQQCKWCFTALYQAMTLAILVINHNLYMGLIIILNII
ncbi:hypothetical protein SSYIS1_06350 [Serratia symbiotica]|uniref:Uncharacterized protein n=1 Tax=Serratia symbiotica TaxID=138074 RepID=A0A455VEL8_9GAMM|nr:hypothetical protein SSYIS1_06350 [Serratia symbiotica]